MRAAEPQEHEVHTKQRICNLASLATMDWFDCNLASRNARH